MLPIRARSNKTAKEGAARKHLAARSWKFVRNADVDISSATSTAVCPVEYLNPFNDDSCLVVNGDPGCCVVVGQSGADPTVWQGVHWNCVSVNAVVCSQYKVVG